MTYTTIWFIIFILFLIAEIVTAGPLVSIWFCAGALCAMLGASVGLPFIPQFIVFLVFSIALLVATKPLVNKYINKKIIKTNVDAIVGQKAIVLEDINNLEAKGAVKIEGKIWTARSLEETQHFVTGDEVIVDHIEGVKVIVKNIN